MDNYGYEAQCPVCYEVYDLETEAEVRAKEKIYEKRVIELADKLTAANKWVKFTELELDAIAALVRFAEHYKYFETSTAQRKAAIARIKRKVGMVD